LETPLKLVLNLVGPLRLICNNGSDLTPRGAKTQGMLVLLGSAPNLRRSRAFLQDKLWSDRGPEQGSASLRQSLVELRRSLGECRDCLKTEAKWVALDPGRVRVVMVPEAGDWGPLGDAPEFAEGLDVADPEFEDWIRDQRLAFADRLSTWPGPDTSAAGGSGFGPTQPAPIAEAVRAAPSGAASWPPLLRHWRGMVAGVLLVLLLLGLREALLSPPASDEEIDTIDLRAAIGAGPSIAVLPFEFTGTDPEQLGFVEAVSREIVTDLAQSRRLFVVDVDATFGDTSPQGAGPVAALGVGRELGVRYVLRGHVQFGRDDGLVRAITHLIDTDSGRTAWAMKLDGSDERLFAMQEAIVRGVVDNLGPILMPV
jgi:TolB-like protein